MRVQVVLNRENASWILGKFGERLVEELVKSGAEASLNEEPSNDADINHWMSYANVTRKAGRASTMFITHIDDPYKTVHLSKLLGSRFDLGICMSRDMMQALIGWGVPAEALWYVLPALDPPPEAARIRIAIATRLYRDGRKREGLLRRLASEVDLAAFHFEIAGSGWEDVVPELRRAGASVNWAPGTPDYKADYDDLLRAMRSCEYYLYLGMDEGSMGTLDALALGLKPIVTPQGFHLEIPGGITEQVQTYDDLRSTFSRLAGARNGRIAALQTWTWPEYAKDHLRIWNALLEGGRRSVASRLEGTGRYGARVPSVEGLARRTWSGYYRHALSPSRFLDALARTRLMQPARRMLRRLRG
jgi:hypothetical protein